MNRSNRKEPQRASGTVRRFVRILMFHICALIALIILCPFRYAFEMVAPWFRWGIRNWVAFNLPSLGDYWTSAIGPSALRTQRDFIFANPAVEGRREPTTDHKKG